MGILRFTIEEEEEGRVCLLTVAGFDVLSKIFFFFLNDNG